MKKITQVTFGQGIKLPATRVHAGSITWDEKNLRAYFDADVKTLFVFQRKGEKWHMALVFETNIAGLIPFDNQFSVEELDMFVGFGESPVANVSHETNEEPKPERKKPGRKPGFKVATPIRDS
jgi:hypothetical protein